MVPARVHWTPAENLAPFLAPEERTFSDQSMPDSAAEPVIVSVTHGVAGAELARVVAGGRRLRRVLAEEPQARIAYIVRHDLPHAATGAPYDGSLEPGRLVTSPERSPVLEGRTPRQR